MIWKLGVLCNESPTWCAGNCFGCLFQHPDPGAQKLQTCDGRRTITAAASDALPEAAQGEEREGVFQYLRKRPLVAVWLMG